MLISVPSVSSTLYARAVKQEAQKERRSKALPLSNEMKQVPIHLMPQSPQS